MSLRRTRWLESLSPNTRKLYDAYMAAEAEDRASGYYPGVEDDDADDGDADGEDADKANETPLLGDNREPDA